MEGIRDMGEKAPRQSNFSRTLTITLQLLHVVGDTVALDARAVLSASVASLILARSRACEAVVLSLRALCLPQVCRTFAKV